MKWFLSILCLGLPLVLFAADDAPNAQELKEGLSAKESPPKMGNFVLPASQQPGAFISFGENIIDKNQKQLFVFAGDIVGPKKAHFVTVIPGILYGITDNFSLFLNVPMAASFRQGENRSDGLEDLYAQLEYAFYNKKTKTYQDQGTIVGNMSFPTGSTKKNPNTGVGSASFLLGTTFNRTYVDWIFFTSYGAILTTIHDHTKYGNQYLYQAGLGRNIFHIDNKWLFAWILEGTGNYTTENVIQSKRDPNSGGNVIYVTPSLWISSQKLIVQAGAGWPVSQHLLGDQQRNSLLLALNLRVTL